MRKLTSGIQESLVALLCYDAGNQGAKAIHGLIPFKTFDPFFREIAEEAGTYLTKYGKPCGDHLFDIIDALKERKPDDAEALDRVFRSIRQTKDEVNREYVIGRANQFVRRQRMKVTVQKVLPLLQRDDEASIDEAEGMMVAVGKATVNLTHAGTILNDPKQSLGFLDTREGDCFPIGIPELDKYDLGPVRGGLWLAVAPPNRGKTWFAVHKGKTALMHGKRVLHITLEMSEARICQRYIQSMFSVSKRAASDIVLRKFQVDDVGRFIGFKDSKPLQGRPSLLDPKIRAYLTRKMRPLATRPRLVVKQFPTGQLTTRQLGAYLDHLEASINFIPDLVLIDYPDLMEIDSKAYRHDLGRIYKDIRGIGVERNMAMVGYSQSSKLGVNAKIIDITKVAEDFSKMATADIVITYNQTDAEYKLGLARLFVGKAREDQKHFQVLISQSYAIGQFVVDSTRMVDSVYWPLVDVDEEEREDKETE